MELPPALRLAVDEMLGDIRQNDLTKAAESLSRRYRAETRDGKLHLADDLSVQAYLATRLPATYAAVRASLEMVRGAQPDFAPRSLLDVGAGPGTVLFAAITAWPSVEAATLIEASAPARAVGAKLTAALAVRTTWVDSNAVEDPIGQADLVTLSYVLDELDPGDRAAMIDRLWARTGGTLLIVEPGTPAGWRRILAARERLIEAGATIAAPCPHAGPCPVTAPDWCHFARRVARSRVHRLAKGGDVPWEDEKFIFVAATRLPMTGARARVLAPPRTASGKVELKLCQPDASLDRILVTRRDGDIFRIARRVSWGDAF